jgi:hypothetical protein
MKRLVLFLGFLTVIGLVASAQNKKEEKEKAAQAAFEKAMAAIEVKDFVIIVDSYESSSGTIETNTDVAVFLALQKEFVFLQGAIVAGNSYTNKVSVSDYNQVTDKKGNIKIDMQVKGTFMAAKIDIFLKKGSNFADVIITPTKGNARRFSGEIIPSGESKYFKRPGEV